MAIINSSTQHPVVCWTAQGDMQKLQKQSGLASLLGSDDEDALRRQEADTDGDSADAGEQIVDADRGDPTGPFLTDHALVDASNTVEESRSEQDDLASFPDTGNLDDPESDGDTQSKQTDAGDRVQVAERAD